MLRLILSILLCLPPALAYAQADAIANAAAIPLDAAMLAVADAEALSQTAPEVPLQRRYVWCRNEEEVTATLMAVNIAISRAAFDVQPVLIAGGQLVAVDLRVCSFDDEDYQELLSLWSSMADREPYFHARVAARKVKVKPYRASDGKTYDFKLLPVSLAAPHLGEAGPQLEQLVGNPLPLEQSFCPIVRADWFVKEVTSTADGGRYYDFRGLKVGMQLADYLEARGADRKRIEAIGASERAAFISRVTAKARVVSMFQGQGVRVSTGAAIIAVTDDPFDDNLDPTADPFRQLLDSKSNGHEVFVTLPSGWLEYTLWDGDQKLVAEAPPNLVADRTVPEPFTPRLQAAISCIRCHAPKDGWQPFVNEVAITLGDRVTNFGDVRQLRDPNAVLSRLAAKYSGDLSEAVEVAQDAIDRRIFKVCRKSAAEAFAAVGNVVNRYEFEYVTAKTAASELGWIVPADDALGVLTFRKIVPALHQQGVLPDDPIIGRLHVDYLDVTSGERVGMKITRRQWEQVYIDAMNRSLPGLMTAREAKGKAQELANNPPAKKE